MDGSSRHRAGRESNDRHKPNRSTHAEADSAKEREDTTRAKSKSDRNFQEGSGDAVAPRTGRHGSDREGKADRDGSQSNDGEGGSGVKAEKESGGGNTAAAGGNIPSAERSRRVVRPRVLGHPAAVAASGSGRHGDKDRENKAAIAAIARGSQKKASDSGGPSGPTNRWALRHGDPSTLSNVSCTTWIHFVGVGSFYWPAAWFSKWQQWAAGLQRMVMVMFSMKFKAVESNGGICGCSPRPSRMDCIRGSCGAGRPHSMAWNQAQADGNVHHDSAPCNLPPQICPLKCAP